MTRPIRLLNALTKTTITVLIMSFQCWCRRVCAVTRLRAKKCAANVTTNATIALKTASNWIPNAKSAETFTLTRQANASEIAQ